MKYSVYGAEGIDRDEPFSKRLVPQPEGAPRDADRPSPPRDPRPPQEPARR
jgi:hypothetical protein